jgi:hypothetical protein
MAKTLQEDYRFVMFFFDNKLVATAYCNQINCRPNHPRNRICEYPMASLPGVTFSGDCYRYVCGGGY